MSQYAASYIAEVSEKYKTGRAGEHAYRPTFEKFVKAIDKNIGIINDPKRTEYGAPDFIFVKGDLIAGYAETKDINIDLDKTIKTEQLERYFGYSNLILTNYLEFRFFRNGEPYGEPIVVGRLTGGIVQIVEGASGMLENAILDFLTAKPEAIKSGVRLAKIMGGKARRIRDNVKQFLAKESDENKELVKVYETIKQLLVHDLDLAAFADMYAQTLVYGLFVARYYDESPANFTRQEARDLIPASNPFLRHFFDHIAGADFDQRLAYIVGELCEVFQVADVQKLMSQYYQKSLFGEEIKGPDPVIHFYEDFLKEYDPALRKKMGAYYTPLPVVRFIVKAVDDILQKEFKLTDGLADTSKLSNGLHRVQVLDPAVGTGTFISAVIRIIYERLLKTGQKGRWPTYVHHDLLPRLYGFELMMASYTIAHLKLSMAFKETGFWKFHRRLGIYLTNSLEQAETQPNLLSFGLAESIAEEAKEATVVKNTTPIMVVLGNPPYSGESSNNFESANKLVNKYKVEPGGKVKLKERNPKWLNDDYVKFIALAEQFIEKNDEGILGYITNHAYLDNPTFRGMRWHLANTFDEIYIVDLHGNAKKKEVAPDGTEDENIFSIMQGVAIMIGVKKKGGAEKIADVYHADIYGDRNKKFEELGKEINYKKLVLDDKYYFFTYKNVEGQDEYGQGFSLKDLFIEYSPGIVTGRDAIAISESKDALVENVANFLSKDISALDEDKIKTINYRPFDNRYIYYDKSVVGRGRWSVMSNFLEGQNVALIFKRGSVEIKSAPCFISNTISESRFWSRPGMQGVEFSAPLFTYSNRLKITNLKKEIVTEIEKVVGGTTPEDIFDYIYATLHSSSYREKYKEFLKIDFPRVPYPKDKETFKKLVAFGSELRLLHLLESPKLNKLITSYQEDGSNMVEKITYKDADVFINTQQYFGNVPEIAWNFWIGGYQPAQKWLKDRKGRTLTSEDIEHYQKMIVALVETDKIMNNLK